MLIYKEGTLRNVDEIISRPPAAYKIDAFFPRRSFVYSPKVLTPQQVLTCFWGSAVFVKNRVDFVIHEIECSKDKAELIHTDVTFL